MLTWLLVADGVALIVTQSVLFKPLRVRTKRHSLFLWDLLRCPMCFGFWTGLLLAVLGLPLPGLPASWPLWLAAWASGAGASAGAFSIHVVRKLLIQQIKPEPPEEDEPAKDKKANEGSSQQG